MIEGNVLSLRYVDKSSYFTPVFTVNSETPGTLIFRLYWRGDRDKKGDDAPTVVDQTSFNPTFSDTDLLDTLRGRLCI